MGCFKSKQQAQQPNKKSGSGKNGSKQELVLPLPNQQIVFGYWDLRYGPRGNINRHILNYAGVEYEDKRYDHIKQEKSWAQIGLPFPNLPYLIDYEYKLTESKAITMYICEKWAPGLLGANIQDKAKIAMLRDVMSDFYDSIINKAINDNHCKQFDTAKAS